MTRKIHFTALLLTALLVAVGCDVHQWPEPKEPSPESPDPVTLRLRYGPDFWVWRHLYDPKQDEHPVEMYPDSDFDPAHPGTTSVYDNTLSSGLMKVGVKVYRSGNLSNCIAEYEFVREVSEGYDCEVDIELEQGDYEVVAWSQLLEGAGSAPFYEASDFRGIGIIGENYRGSTDHRDAFRGRTSLGFPGGSVSSGEKVFEVQMRRPMGKFEFETIDLSEFLDNETRRRSLSTRAKAEDYTVVISYPLYYPNGYNAVSDDIASDSGYRFETKMTVTGESEASMGFDYVFINNITDGAVQAQVSVYDLAGEQVAHSQTIMIPIRRDHHTILRGAFLTMNANGGVGIDPDYDGDHNVFP